jgi:hypothetical protein
MLIVITFVSDKWFWFVDLSQSGLGGARVASKAIIFGAPWNCFLLSFPVMVTKCHRLTHKKAEVKLLLVDNGVQIDVTL